MFDNNDLVREADPGKGDGLKSGFNVPLPRKQSTITGVEVRKPKKHGYDRKRASVKYSIGNI